MVHTLEYPEHRKFYYPFYSCYISVTDSYLDKKRDIHLKITEGNGYKNTSDCVIGDELIIDMWCFITEAQREKLIQSNIYSMFEKYKILDIKYEYKNFPEERFRQLREFFTVILESESGDKRAIFFNDYSDENGYPSPIWFYNTIEYEYTDLIIENKKQNAIKEYYVEGSNEIFIGSQEIFTQHWASAMCETSFDRTLNELGKVDPFTREKMKSEMTNKDRNRNYLFIFFWGFIPQTKEGYGYLLMTVMACLFWTIWYSRWMLIILTLALYWIFNVKSKASKR